VDDSVNVELPGPGRTVTVTGNTLFESSATPPIVPAEDFSAVELGMKFQSAVGGTATGIRFYKSPLNIGPHSGSLWSSTGTRLATVVFTNETGTGWQAASFSSPVPITPGTTYVVSYHTDYGRYTATSNFFVSPVTSGPLTAPVNAGVYAYGSTSTFPTNTFEAENYWVDVLFNPHAQSATSVSLFSASAIPTILSDPDSNPVELGMKFQVSEAGSISGIKFYKGTGNTGTHEAHLWTDTGILLGTAIFTNETASGWQTAMLSSPVPITPGTTYVVSYHSNGHYAASNDYFTTDVVNGPLKAMADTASNPNGVYAYGGSGLFPTNSFQKTNYWVDVIFNPQGVA
jgi:hypothetical protein